MNNRFIKLRTSNVDFNGREVPNEFGESEYIYVNVDSITSFKDTSYSFVALNRCVTKIQTVSLTLQNNETINNILSSVEDIHYAIKGDYRD